MKKTILFLVVTLTFFASCKKDNQSNKNTNLIIGKWTALYIEEIYPSYPEKHISHTFKKGEYLEFIEDNVFFDYWTGDYNWWGYSPKLKTGYFSISENDLQFKYGESNKLYTIETITAKKLILTYEFNDNGMGITKKWCHFTR